jgi:crotonobetainyl-CoA:carnitine CoA-transferase CaiB-like acyl-CoA transferase
MDQICGDLTVIEIGGGSSAAAETGMMLADNGARVIKVEAPGGDLLRSRTPAGWLVWNRGKESLECDLTDPSQRDRLRSLIQAADVVIESLDAGQAEAFAIGYDDVQPTNPGLIYCSIKGFGPTGEYANVPADDALVMAKAGSFSTGAFGFRSGPIFSGARAPSNGAAAQAVAGIMAALVVRDKTGIGQRVDASLYLGLSAGDYFVSYHVQLGARMMAEQARLAASAPPAEEPASPPPSAPVSRYMVGTCTRDGRWMYFSPQLPHQAAALVKVLGLDWMFDDERFAKMPTFSSLEDAAAWEDAIHERMKERDLPEWIELALANPDLPFEVVLSAEEALDHPQVRANGNVIVVQDPELGDIEEVGPVGDFSETPSQVRASAPNLDDHGSLPEVRSLETGNPSLPTHPLEGITIVEFGYFYAMPFGVTMAGALGARVIKIENIDGDPMRWSFGLPEWGATKTMEGKESICIDLRSDVGREIVHELLRRADVFVQGFRPGVDVRLGVDYETVQALNPNIVYVHGAGYGQEGPYAYRPIYAGTVAAAAGSVHRQAAHWLDPELNKSLSAMECQAVVAPRMRNLTDGDANAAVGVLAAIMLALRHRQRTGQGQFVGTSMLGGNVLAYSDDFNRYRGKVPLRQADPEQYGLSATYRLYETSGGWVFFGVRSEAEWARAAELAGWSELLDEGYGSLAGDADADASLEQKLTARFAERTSDSWESLFLSQGVGCVAVTDRLMPEMAAFDTNLQTMGLIVEIEHPLFGQLRRYGPPARLSATPGRVAPGCVVAQHTASLLAELGYEEEQITKLANEGVVRVAEK